MPPFVHRLRVRYAECDAQSVVFNAQYFAYFDHTLTEMWRDRLGGYTGMLAAGVDVVVANASARFIKAARFDEELDIGFEVVKLGTTSLVSRLPVHRDGELLVEGEMVHVFVDAGTHAKRPIPDHYRAALEDLQTGLL